MTRLDMVAVGWGSMVASVGLLAASEREIGVRLGVVAVACGVGGFLAGVRSVCRRLVHGVAAGVTAHAIQAIFIATATGISLITGPEAPDPFPGGADRTGLVALWAVAFAAIGGLLAGMWLRPAGGSARQAGRPSRKSR